ncbi:hypothetical protein [Roseibium sp. MB-4]
MAFSKHVQNPFPLLSELKSSISEKEDDSYTISVSLSLYNDALDCSNEKVKVAFSEATLHVKCDGFDIIDGSKIGENVKGLVSIREYTEERTSSENLESMGKSAASAKLSAKLPSVGGELSENFSTEEKIAEGLSVKQTEKIEDHHIRVRSIGGDRWKISEAQNGVLNGKYLNQSSLFGFVAKDRANYKSVSLALSVRQKDMNISFESPAMFANIGKMINKKRISDILISKSLHSSTFGENEYSGVLVLSRNDHEYDHHE